MRATGVMIGDKRALDCGYGDAAKPAHSTCAASCPRTDLGARPGRRSPGLLGGRLGGEDQARDRLDRHLQDHHRLLHDHHRLLQYLHRLLQIITGYFKILTGYSKFDNVDGCSHSLPDGIMRATDV